MSKPPNPRMNSIDNDLYVVDTMSMISSTDKSSHTRFIHASISPDGQQIVTFDPETFNVDIYSTEDLIDPISSFTYDFAARDPQTKQIRWSLAISDCVSVDNERLIALSRFDSRDVIIRTNPSDTKLHVRHPVDDVEFGEENLSENCIQLKPKTWVILASLQSEVKTEIRKIGGIVKFFDNNVKDSIAKGETSVVIINTSGIYKQTFQNSEIRKNRKQFPWVKLTPDVEQFYLPEKLHINLSHPDHFQDGREILHNSIIKNHFLVNSYKAQQHSVEMYDLITGDLEMVFQHHDLPVSPKVVHGLPIFAISQNDAMLAFCRGTTSITLYLMENGLEIVTKKIMGGGFQKIVSMNFIDDDSRLLILIEEGDVQHKHQVFVVWDLFTTYENAESAEGAIRSIRSGEETQRIDRIRPLLGSRGKIFAVTEGGDLSSLLDHPDVSLIRNSKVQSNMTVCEVINDDLCHSIFKVNGDRIDAHVLKKQKLIINHVEPWQRDKKYVRVSAYLHSDKRTQLTVGPDTVQVWHYRKVKDSDLHERVLEYIWAKNGGDKLQILELLIGEREFVLRLMVSSNERRDPQPMTIHWPNNINVLEGACRALRVLRDKKREVMGSKNINKRETLINHTQRLVRRYIRKSGLFRLTDIRYPIMENLIRSRQTKLIQSALRNKKNGKNERLHIPRLHEWANVDGTMKLVPKRADLQIAIECTGIHENSAIVEFLLDYYADNAKDYNNPGWMLTVTQAIPLLYDYKLDHLVRELFKKPCFGTIEAYTPPLHISYRDRKLGNSTDTIHVIDGKPQLARKPPVTTFTKMTSFFTKLLERIKRFFIKPSAATINPSYNNRKVYVVPLPNFTIYPESCDEHESGLFGFLRALIWPRKRVIKNVEEMSPFLRVIFEDGSTDLHRTPSINAITSFKWKATRNYFLRHVALYILFGISFGIRSINYAININLTNKPFSTAPGDLTISIFNILFLCTGWYLLATEIMELGNEGLQRYMDIFNIFDVGSVILPLGLNIADWFFNMDFYLFTMALSFTILIMWFELLLLMRYFEAPGRFIYIIMNILNTIWPFFAFMLIAIMGFGNAMFILLKNAPRGQFQIDTYKIFNPRNNSDGDWVMQHQVDRNSRIENYYSNLLSAAEAVFFWTNGRWDQLDLWDNYAVDVMSVLGSMILVLIFQNMLIAFMNGAFDRAKEASRSAVYVFRADLISEHETLDKPFCKEGKVRYIYFIPNPDIIDSWLLYIKKRSAVWAGDEELTESDDCGDEDEEIHRKHYSDTSSDSNKIDHIYGCKSKVELVDEEHTVKSKSRFFHHSPSSSFSTVTTLNNRSSFSISPTPTNRSIIDYTLFSIPEGDAGHTSVGGETISEQSMALQKRFDDVERIFTERMIKFTERFDALERKVITVLEFLSNQ